MVDIATEDYSVNIEKDIKKESTAIPLPPIQPGDTEVTNVGFSDYDDIIVDVEVKPISGPANSINDLVENHFFDSSGLTVVISNLNNDTTIDEVEISVKALLLG